MNENMPKKSSPMRFLTALLIALLLPVIASAQAPSDMPPGCLVAVEIHSLPALTRQAAEFAPGWDLQQMAASWLGMGPLEQAGLDPRAPIRFYLINPKANAQPWVFQVTVADEAAFRKAVTAQRPNAARRPLRFDGRTATFGDLALAGKLLLWQTAHPGLPAFRTEGALRAKLDAQLALAAHDGELNKQFALMKERMHEALARRETPDAEQEMTTLQAQLDAAMAAVRQVQTLEVSLTPGDASILLSARLTPLPGSLLAKVIAAHPRSGLDLLRLCPADATVVVAHNLALKDALRGILKNMLGLVGLRGLGSVATAEPAGTGGRALAVLLEPGATGGSAQFLYLREAGYPALAAEWERFVKAPAEAPFRLEPNPDAGIFAQGRVVLNDAVLGADGLQLLHRMLGEQVFAALADQSQTGILAVGNAAPQLAAKARALAEDRSLARAGAFAESLSGLPKRPNLLAYVSADGIRRWLLLGGRDTGPLVPDEPGLAAALEFSPSGEALAGLRLPTARLRRALAGNEGK